MKILVIGPSWIGDMMMSQSLYRLLTQHYPDVEIDVMAPAWCCPLLKHMPEVSQSITIPFEHGTLALGKRRQLGKSLKNHGYQQALILPNSFKSVIIPFFANIPRRTGWRGEMRYGFLNDIRTLDKNFFPLMVQRYAALAFDRQMMHITTEYPLPWPRLVVSPNELLTVFQLNNKRPIIGFCPGAEFGPAKCWPHYHYATLASKLITRGYQIVLFGSIKDYSSGETISAAIQPEKRVYCHNLVGRTSLDQAISLIAACQGIVSNDSGLMHVASALERPLVVLYGPSSPNFTPPLSYKARIIRLINGYYKIRKGNNPQGYHPSLINIQPSQVLSELENLLASFRINNADINC